MKKSSTMKMLICIISAAIVGKTAFAQKKIEKPEFMYQVYHVAKNGSLDNLDKEELATETKIHIIGIANLADPPRAYQMVNGCCATSSHSGDTSEKYIVRVEPGIDPESMVMLYKFEIIKEKRKILLKKAFSNQMTSSMPIHFKRVDDGVYLISYSTSLVTGEYVFKIKNQSNTFSVEQARDKKFEKGFCFSVK